jgi:two-component system, response regulator
LLKEKTLSEPAEILLVEDNQNDVELVMHALRQSSMGDRVAVVRDGADALEYVFCTGKFAGRLMADAPRVVLLDLKLPKVSGKEVLRSLKTDLRTSSIPVIALTSSIEESDITDTYRLGVNSYIVKPVDFDEYAQALRQIGLYWLRLNVNTRLSSG